MVELLPIDGSLVAGAAFPAGVRVGGCMSCIETLTYICNLACVCLKNIHSYDYFLNVMFPHFALNSRLS